MKYILKQKEQINNKEFVVNISNEFDIDINIAQIIANRGISSLDEVRRFLNPNLEQLEDPFLFNDMADCVSTIKSVIASKGKICVYGDYDVDGTCGCAIMYLTLKQMGADVFYMLPNRQEHGYGLSMQTIDSILGYSLIITVDCGITNVEEIEYAKKKGIKTIITDHHECPSILPKADYIINAKRKNEKYPFEHLCGAGVAFKVSQALIREKALQYIDIAALATISDIVPILKENRAITKLGLEKLNTNPNKGVLELIKQAGIKKPFDTTSVSFGLAPRINSAGRISTALISLELLIQKGDVEKLSRELCDLNIERQRRQEYIINSALKMDFGNKDDKIIVLFSEDWDIGIVGLAASKLVDMFNKPALLLGKCGEFFTGSARSIPGVNIYEALSTQADMYEKFGGHYGAAGITIKEENLERLSTRLNQYLKEKYEKEVFYPVKYYDLDLKIKDITKKTIEDSEKLKPYGYKNEQIEILIRKANLHNKSGICDDKHSKFVLKQNEHILNGVAFGAACGLLPRYADVIGTVNINTYDNKLQMIVKNFSFEEHTKLNNEMKIVLNIQTPTMHQKKTYFCSREELSKIFAFLKDIAKLNFKNKEELSAFCERKFRNLKKFSFAVIVFNEIGLLEIQKNDKINIIINEGKFELANSATFNKFE